ncbi:MAG: CvpA family protein [Firmicutes bacterium]|nr:CvpA family protein [Bacillota bacterium]MCL5040526.1 CvpA family protein [Bacillota bacterium]
MNWVDWLIVLYLAFRVLIGYRRGFLLVLLDLLAFVVPLVVAISFQGALTGWLEKSLPIKDFITTRLQGYIPAQAQSLPLDRIPLDEIKRQLAALGLPESFSQAFLAALPGGATGAGAVNNLLAALAQSITDLVASLLAFLLLYWAVSLLFGLLKAPLASWARKVDILGINRLGGAILGLVWGGLGLSLVLGFSNIVLSLGGYSQLGMALRASRLAGLFLPVFDRLLPLLFRV